MSTVADYILQRLREWDVEQVFGYAGDGINGLLAAWQRADDQPRFIQARHEEMAAFEACRLRQVLRPGRGVHRHQRARGDPPAQRSLRRQARPCRGSWRSSARRPARPWVAPTSRRSTCSACTRTWPASTARW